MQWPEVDPVGAFWQWLASLKLLLSGAASPFWWPSLLSALLAGVVLAWVAGHRAGGLLGYLFPRDRAYLKELPVDLACWLAGSSLPFLLAPLMYLVSVGGTMVGVYAMGMPDPDAPAPGTGVLLLSAVLAFVFGDFALYWTHRLFHRYPLLWRAHALHHRPTVLTPLTGFRFWPQEQVVHMTANVFAQGIALGLMVGTLGLKATPYTVLGVNVFTLVWNVAFSHLRHSHLPLPFPRWLSYVLVSPHMHQAHHSVSVEHHDKNFATVFSLWDWMFGTLYIPARDERFRFGVEAAAAPVPAATPAPAPAAQPAKV